MRNNQSTQVEGASTTKKRKTSYSNSNREGEQSAITSGSYKLLTFPQLIPISVNTLCCHYLQICHQLWMVCFILAHFIYLLVYGFLLLIVSPFHPVAPGLTRILRRNLLPRGYPMPSEFTGKYLCFDPSLPFFILIYVSWN